MVYVGKAKNLRARLTSYFQDIVNLHPRTATMVTTAASVEWTVVNTEVEALQLEYSWIKEFDPRFNVKYRDDKSYPWLAVTVGEEFPRVMVGRGAKRKGTRYFGPYSHAWAIRETVDLLLRVFPMRSCSNGVFKRAGADRPARACSATSASARRPASAGSRAEEHRAIVDDFCDFMAGQTARSSSASRRRCTPRPTRRTTSGPPGCATTSARSTGRWRSRRSCSATAPTPTWSRWPRTRSRSPCRSSTSAAAGSAASAAGWPTRPTTPTPRGSSSASCSSCTPARSATRSRARSWCPRCPRTPRRSSSWLSDLRGARVSIRVPQRGDKKALQETVGRNALQALGLHKTKRASDLTTRNRALEEIQHALGLPTAPLRIECYDISNLQGTEVVASMVVFEDGLPRKSEYRRFVIKGVEGQNDVASMHEVITRRFRRLLDERVETGELADDRDRDRRRGAARCSIDPDTGRPRSSPTPPASSSSTAVRRRSRPPSVRSTSSASTTCPSCGLAKRLEEVWLPGQEDPVILPRTSEGLYLLQRIRDEAHRFAITHHRSRRSKSHGREPARRRARAWARCAARACSGGSAR